VGFYDARQRLPVSNSHTSSSITAASPDGPIIVENQRLPSTLGTFHTSPARLIFTTGLVISLILALLAFLDLRPRTTAIFGFLAIAFFLMLLRTPRKPVASWTAWRGPGAAEGNLGQRDL
jgi:hypothetical protein